MSFDADKTVILSFPLPSSSLDSVQGPRSGIPHAIRRSWSSVTIPVSKAWLAATFPFREIWSPLACHVGGIVQTRTVEDFRGPFQDLKPCNVRGVVLHLMLCFTLTILLPISLPWKLILKGRIALTWAVRLSMKVFIHFLIKGSLFSLLSSPFICLLLRILRINLFLRVKKMANARLARFVTEVAPLQIVNVMRHRSSKVLDTITEEEREYASPNDSLNSSPKGASLSASSSSLNFGSAAPSTNGKYFLKGFHRSLTIFRRRQREAFKVEKLRIGLFYDMFKLQPCFKASFILVRFFYGSTTVVIVEVVR